MEPTQGAPSLRGLPYFVSSDTNICMATGLATTKLTVKFSEAVKLWSLGARFAIKSTCEVATDFRRVFREGTGQELNDTHEASKKKTKKSQLESQSKSAGAAGAGIRERTQRPG